MVRLLSSFTQSAMVLPASLRCGKVENVSEKPTNNLLKTASLDDIRKMKNAGNLKPAKKATLAPEELPKEFWDDAEIVETKTKTAVSLRVDADVLEYFKSQGKGHLTRMNAVLRSYVKAQRSR